MYALALIKDEIPDIIEQYLNIRQLETGYQKWKDFADKRKITPPTPIEIDNSGRYNILTEIIYAFDKINSN